MSYFNTNAVQNESPEVAVNEVPLTAQQIEINAEVLKHHIEFLEYLGFENGLFRGNLFLCPSLFSENPRYELFELDLVTGEWVDHGEEVSGVGMLSLQTHVDSFTTEEGVVVLQKWLKEISETKPGRKS